MKFNITVGEIEDILNYAHKMKREGKDTICLDVILGEIGTAIEVSSEWDGEFEDITDYEAW